MKDGLSGDRVREIKEDASGNIYIGTLAGISKFDGRSFVTLTPFESLGLEGWRLNPNDLWFKGDSMADGPYRYDGTTLYRYCSEIPSYGDSTYRVRLASLVRGFVGVEVLGETEQMSRVQTLPSGCKNLDPAA